MRSWRGATVQLLPDEWYSRVYNLSTLTCDPIKDMLPTMLTYLLHPATAPVTDLMWSTSQFHLYSPPVANLLDEFRVVHETVPALVRNRRDRIVTSDHVYVHFLSCLEALDWERSDVDTGLDVRGKPYVRVARRLVLREDIEHTEIPVFRLTESKDLLLVAEQFRKEWERRGLTGARFRSLESYSEH